MWTLSGCQAAKAILESNPSVEQCKDVPDSEKEACVKIHVKDKEVK